MATVTQTIPSYLGGVSKQPDDKKMPGQLVDCVNAYPDPTFGLTKRPGFKWIKNLGSSSPSDTYENAKWFYIHRDGDEKYMGCIKGNQFYIWNVTTGVAVTMTYTSPAQAYLDGTSPTHYDILTVQDTTIVTNKTKTVGVQTAPTFNANRVGTVRLRAVTAQTTYTVSIKIGSTTNTATFTTGDAATADGILTDLKADIDGWSGDFDNLTVTRLDTSLEISSTVDFTLNGKGGADNERLDTYQNQVANVSDLPDRSKQHRVVKILNTASSTEDTYYSRFIANDGVSGQGHWEEFIAPDVSPGLDSATMPHELINTGTNAFTFRPAAWTDRLVGDETTNSPPSFNTKKIQQAFFHSNRLGFLTEDNVSMSQAGEYFNFYHVSAMTQVASDPVDLSTSSIRPTLLTGVLTTAQGLILFSKNQQFLMYAPNGIFTPTTTIIRGVSNYEMDIDMDPVDNGTNIFFLSKTPSYSRIFQMKTAGQEMNPQVLDVGRVVSEWIPDTVTEITASPQNSFIAMYGPSKPDIYFYRTYSDGQQEVMQSWFRWSCPGKIQTIAVDSDVLYGVTVQGNQYTLVSASLNQTPDETILVNSDGTKMNPCVDLYATATAVKYQGIDDFTVTAGGTNYTSAPTVVITPILSSEGSGAAATATVSGGAVTAITLTDAGSGYADGATISFTGGGGSGATATCTVYDGSKCYIPFTDDADLSTVLVVGSDAADLTNPTFVESGFTVTPTRGTDDVGTYFSILEKDLSAVASKVIVGFKYTYDITLPKVYYKLNPEGTIADYTASLTVSRMKFSTGLSGVVGFKLKPKGAAEWTDVHPTVDANFYLANDVPLTDQSVLDVPIHQRNGNFTLRAYSDSPFPVSLTSSMWEGNYSPRFYRRT
jgi:hypothetical protein